MKNFLIGTVKWIIGLVFLYFFFKLSSSGNPRLSRNYVRNQHRPLYNKLIVADCNTLDKELDSVLESTENPEPRVIDFIKRRMELKECN